MPKCLRIELTIIAQNHRPFEACGTLLAKKKCGSIEVCRIRICENLAQNKIAGFRLSSDEVEKAKADWRVKSNQIIGVFHTHGLGGANPSLHDQLVMRSRPGLYLIADADGDIQAFLSSFNNLLRLKFVDFNA